MQKEIKLQLAHLRKRKGITQQKVANIVGTSYQNISKWENGITLPDITVLPVLADYFGVTTDQLLGLVALQDEGYKEEKTDTDEFWDQKLSYLLRKQKINWNEDYFEFLLEKVWKIKEPIDILDIWEYCCCNTCHKEVHIRELIFQLSCYNMEKNCLKIKKCLQHLCRMIS